MEEGQLRIKQSFLSAKETFPLTSRHLGSSQLLDRLPFFFSGNITVNEHKPVSINDVQ